MKQEENRKKGIQLDILVVLAEKIQLTESKNKQRTPSQEKTNNFQLYFCHNLYYIYNLYHKLLSVMET